MTDELEEFLNDELGEETNEETTEDVVTEEEETPKTETVDKEEEAPTAPEDEAKPEDKTPETMPMSAFMGIKSENKELKQQLENLKNSTPQQPKEEPDFFENPDETLAQHRQQIRNETSELIARDKYDDFEEKAQRFGEMLQENPALLAQMNTQYNPAEFVYQTATKDMQLQEIGSIEDYKAKLDAEYAEKIKAFETKANTAEIPPSMVDVRSTAGSKAPVSNNLLDEIFPD